MKPTRVWILIADATRARVLAPHNEGRDFRTIEGLTFSHDDPKTSDVVRDRLARTFESVGQLRHAVTPPTDPHREEKRVFAEFLAEFLDRERAKKSFDRLVIVAPPQFLGDLRHTLTEPVRTIVSATLDLDLTKTPDEGIAAHFKNVVIA